MRQLDINLREYLRKNHDKLIWKERIKITVNIIKALVSIHKENLIHRDLHSGNILYDCYDTNSWFISDFGFCGPAGKSTESIYGNLLYIAPEVINGNETTFKSDIYSIAMLMWEISAGQPPFFNYERDNNLATNIISGMRPEIITGTPTQYKELIIQCWDNDPLKRPDIDTLKEKINILYQNMPNASDNLGIFSSNFLNKAQTEEKCTEEKCTEEQDEEFHSKLYDDFNIPDNIDDFDNTNDDNNNKANNIIKDISNEKSFLSNEYIQREIQEAIQGIIQHREEKYYIVQKQIMKYHQYFIIEKYDVQNNPNLHDIRKYLWRNLIA
ncbi:kinase-like domain-containing protein [Rhizophagus irregularis DAOM 181602=DAOM 197198]|nr:kinase-like domain-containing protein [Rhizophagus irregularis DAOM 181602=DAOM 197198]